ncbi:hypothetical protein BJ085DRAFT_37390 [Dimargaris cristalligena]|uniref:Uncharacterized protein n=1 Tax=Dimargaris cristalligena TaxID=215637 RepID=A0A4P9ZV80_9FUNG|nr:hypothetical protein BJ085DRAFT_37390 [Dimargaris cristalligena]|eukprot:RKP37526.1 hypothetical protein BJ085DRAFT_37390 [Dimargaris cristalligena]
MARVTVIAPQSRRHGSLLNMTTQLGIKPSTGHIAKLMTTHIYSPMQMDKLPLFLNYARLVEYTAPLITTYCATMAKFEAMPWGVVLNAALTSSVALTQDITWFKRIHQDMQQWGVRYDAFHYAAVIREHYLAGDRAAVQATLSSLLHEELFPCIALLCHNQPITPAIISLSMHRALLLLLIVYGGKLLLDQLDLWAQPGSYAFYTILLQGYGRFKGHPAFTAQGTAMQHHPHSMVHSTFFVLMDCCRTHSALLRLSDVLSLAHDRGLELNTRNFTSLVKYDCYTNAPQAGIGILRDEMPRRRIAVDRVN